MAAKPSFDPSNFSMRKHRRLDELLNDLTMAVALRGELINAGYLEALKKWVNNPPIAGNMPNGMADRLAVSAAIPEDRWIASMQESLKASSMVMSEAARAIVRFEELDISKQKEGISYTTSEYERFIDRPRDRKHWKTVSGIYRAVLTEFPDILNNEEDSAGSERLGNILKDEKEELDAFWKNASDIEKAEKAKSILHIAYPKDDVPHLHMAVLETKTVEGAYSGNLITDTMICGTDTIKSKHWESSMFVFAHEYNHRRQRKLVQKLKEDRLTSGSAEHYQAWLFKANLAGGGYLVPSEAHGVLQMYARLADYITQPVEFHANENAKFAHDIGCTAMGVTWSVGKAIFKSISAITRPFDVVSYGIDRATSASTERKLSRYTLGN